MVLSSQPPPPPPSTEEEMCFGGYCSHNMTKMLESEEDKQARACMCAVRGPEISPPSHDHFPPLWDTDGSCLVLFQEM